MVGVGIVVFNNDNQILLIQRSQEPNEGLWALPGGLVEVGEELETAVKREVLEECNIHIDVEELVSVLDLILKDENQKVKYHYILIDYAGTYLSGDLKPQSDAKNAGWFHQNELDNLNIPEATFQVILKAFEKRSIKSTT
jgi:mutator protein MutT